MRFRFCGDGDCPDWLLPQINKLSKMTSVQVENIANYVADSLRKTSLKEQDVKEMMEGANLDLTDAKTVIAAVAFILENSTANGVTRSFLYNELQQIGLLSENALAFCRVYEEKSAMLISGALQENLNKGVPKAWNVKKSPEDSNVICFEVRDSNGKEHSFRATRAQTDVMIEDFKTIQKRMKNM